MRSTGEVMGIDSSFPVAFAKAQMAAGNWLPTGGRVFISVNNEDKPMAVEVGRMFQEMDFILLSTRGTAAYLMEHGLTVETVNKKYEGPPDAQTMITEGRVHLVINTPIGEEAITDDSYIRKTAVEHNVPVVTTMTGAKAIAEAIAALRDTGYTVRSIQEYLATEADAVTA